MPPQLTLEDANDQVSVPVKRRRHAKSAPQSSSTVPVCPSTSGAISSSQHEKKIRLDKGQTITHANIQTHASPICKIDKLNAKQGGLGLGQSLISFISVKSKVNGENSNHPPYTRKKYGPNTLDEGDYCARD